MASHSRRHSPPSRRQPVEHRHAPRAGIRRESFRSAGSQQAPWSEHRRGADEHPHPGRASRRPLEYMDECDRQGSSDDEEEGTDAQEAASDFGFGFRDPRGVAWCESGNGERMVFVNADEVEVELLAAAKSACGSLAYWVRELASSPELDRMADGGWPAELVPSGHCDAVCLSDEAGDLAGLRAAATGSNKKVRGQALALAVLLAADRRLNISNEALREHHPELVELVEASMHAYEAVCRDSDARRRCTPPE